MFARIAACSTRIMFNDGRDLVWTGMLCTNNYEASRHTDSIPQGHNLLLPLCVLILYCKICVIVVKGNVFFQIKKKLRPLSMKNLNFMMGILNNSLKEFNIFLNSLNYLNML